MYFQYGQTGLEAIQYIQGSLKDTYYVVTNLQGDVIALIDGSGTEVVSYTYDAWGNLRGIAGSLASTVGTYNPIRYRGYVYDTDTGLYYLNSRYYNPEWGRFINADIYVSTGQGMTGANMFAYCGNNPVNRVDYEGTVSEKATEFVIGALIEGVIYLIECAITRETVKVDELIIAAISGGLSAIVRNPGILSALAGLEASINNYMNGGDLGTALINSLAVAAVTFVSPSTLARFEALEIDLEEAFTKYSLMVFDVAYRAVTDAINFALAPEEKDRPREIIYTRRIGGVSSLSFRVSCEATKCCK